MSREAPPGTIYSLFMLFRLFIYANTHRTQASIARTCTNENTTGKHRNRTLFTAKIPAGDATKGTAMPPRLCASVSAFARVRVFSAVI